MRSLKSFKASWCGPCKQLTPKLEELVKEGHKVEMLDVDDHMDAAKGYGVRAVPTTLVMEGEEVLQVIIGDKPKQDYLDALTN